MQVKKYIVLGILFVLPLTIYVFFASGTDLFKQLPVLTENVKETTAFTTSEGKPVMLHDKITVLSFLGTDPLSKKANAFNLTHKIYNKYAEFEDFQFVTIVPEGTEADVAILKNEISEIADTKRWVFGFGTPENIDRLFSSLQTDYMLASDSSTPFVFIIDKNKNLRGRTDDDDVGIMQGFDARNYSEINNKMDDDVKVVLAEYRLALKKNNSNRQI
ncbi:hypothetical protein ACFQO1_09730 [Jejudonia soesokkakensis]|uniref:Uncharacterized protein n=1 Tax=Jejudonia soesokkakensis TaxID=1323432 RepID=A0ABW2MSR9_9FLAO